MKRAILAAVAGGAMWTALWAQAGNIEPLSSWQYVKDVPAGGASLHGLTSITMDRYALDHARTDLADLRLYDAAGREVPYALHIRREVEAQDDFAVRTFNRATSGGSATVSCDLGEAPPEHNRVEITASGSNFRRAATVEGSADGAAWVTLAGGALLFRFSSGGRVVEQDAVEYPTSRYRYLRIRLERDPQTEKDPPEIAGVRVRLMVRAAGDILSFQGMLEAREPGRAADRAASIWTVDFGGRIPVQGLEFSIAPGFFSRPYQVEAVDGSTRLYIASGDLVRKPDSSPGPLRVKFSERFVRKLRITFTDDRNAALDLRSVTALSAARQIVFEGSSALRAPLRLYYGNEGAAAPHYDIASRLPANAEASTRLNTGPERPNPIYKPAPKPFTERIPWLSYVVLGGAGAALAVFLLKIARAKAE